MNEKTPAPAAAGTTPSNITVALETPIVRGEQRIESITLRKPVSGELRGLKLSDLLNADVTSMQTLIPRISTPSLTVHEVANLDVVDFAEITGRDPRFFHVECATDGAVAITKTVEDAMADIALVFGWHPADMADMPLHELMEWRERARLRNGTEEC